MESFLSMLAGWFMGLWTWLLELNGMLQVGLVLLCVVASGVCAIIGKRMGSPMIVESGGQTWSRTLVTAIAWIAGVILMLIAVLAIALTTVLFTSLFTIAMSINDGIQKNNRAGREGIPAPVLACRTRIKESQKTEGTRTKNEARHRGKEIGRHGHRAGVVRRARPKGRML